MTAAIVCSDLSFSWPDGTPVLSGLTASFGPGRTGLIGVNGSGKSTLLRLIAGQLHPGSGQVRADGDVGYLPQAITLGTHRTVSDLLGITAARAALHAIEAGQVGEEVFAAIGDDWDVEERARAWLDRLGLDLALDDRVEQLSGGETILAALAALFLRRPGILLLDEPTNNLDLDARQRLYDAVASWTGVMVIVSHDRELLGLVDQIADLSAGSIRMYGGNLLAYEELVAAEQAAAERAVSAAEAGVRRERRDLAEAQTKQARRDRQGRKLAESGSLLGREQLLVRGQVAAVHPDAPGGQVGDLVDQPEQFAVVADDHHDAAPEGNRVVEPPARVQVEIVGRLVEQHDVRTAQEQRGERGQDGLAAGQALDPVVEG